MTPQKSRADGRHRQREILIHSDIPDLILVLPKHNMLPEIIGSCDEQDKSELKSIGPDGAYLYRRVGKRRSKE